MFLKLKIFISIILNKIINYKIVNGNLYRMPSSVSKAFRPFYNNKVEVQEVSLIRNETNGVNNIVDVGANIGLLSLEIAKTANGGIYCFEPNPYTFSKLVEFVGLNNKNKDFKFVCAAVGEKSGFTDFYVSERDYLGVMSSQVNTDPSAKLIKVPVISLDDYFDGKTIKIDFIKIDVEGAELFVLKGAEKILKEDSPMLLIEIHGPFLHRFGYTVSDFFEYVYGLGYKSYNILTSQLLTPEDFIKNSGKYVLNPISGEDMSNLGYGSVLFKFNEN